MMMTTIPEARLTFKSVEAMTAREVGKLSGLEKAAWQDFLIAGLVERCKEAEDLLRKVSTDAGSNGHGRKANQYQCAAVRLARDADKLNATRYL